MSSRLLPTARAASTRPSWHRPVLQYVAAGLIAATLVAYATGGLSRRAAQEEAVLDAKATTDLLARSVIQPALPRGLVGGNQGARDRFDRISQSRAMGGPVMRVKLWDVEGTVLYSDVPQLIGRDFELGGDELAVLEMGGTEAERSDLSKDENVFDRPLGDVVEVYTQVRSPEGDPLLFEVYFSAADVTSRADEVFGAFRPISVGGLLLFLGMSVPLVWLLARRLDTAATEREGLLLAAVEASDVERRRVARDLHDGVVQDLAGTAFTLAANSRSTSEPDLSHRLETLAGRVRQSLRTLRSLLVEIYPPDLHTAGLAAALDDLVAPASAAGVRVELDVIDTHHIPEEVVSLLWRTAQEATRNALRHGRPRHLQVCVRQQGVPSGTVVLEVVDDGAGFDPDQPVPTQHFGLRSLRDLVRVVGGRLHVHSVPGEGTRLTLEVSLP